MFGMFFSGHGVYTHVCIFFWRDLLANAGLIMQLTFFFFYKHF